MAKRLTFYIMMALLAGIVVGAIIHFWYGGSVWARPKELSAAINADLAALGKYFDLATGIFLRLIKMIIAPLVFATLVAGIAHMGDTKSLGRVGLKTMLWFIGATIISLILGMALANLIEPGINANMQLPPPDVKSGITAPKETIFQIIEGMVPKSIVQAMAENILLQIVIFSVFFGVAVASVGEKAAPILKGVDALVDVMLQVTNYVMLFSPVAVFAAMTKAITINGLGVIEDFAWFIGSFYLGLALLWAVLIFAGFLVIGPRIATLVKLIRDPILLAFSTASSEAAYPRTLEALSKFGVPNKICSFVLPLGYSFNLDGSMMYMTFATLFIAQLSGIELSFGQQVAMFITLMLTSKGMAAVPRASLVVISGTMAQFGIPEAGLVLILAVDQFLDMGRTGTNVVGNAVATAVVAKWEGVLEAPKAETAAPEKT